MSYKNPNVSLPDDKYIKKSRSKSNIGQKYETMEPAYFVFLDVLGFKETYDNNRNQFRTVFEYFNSLINNMRCIVEDQKNCYAGQTSDSLYFYTNNLSYLIEFINVFLHFNIYAMSKNVFFRGGIAKGQLFRNEPYQFFGDCVINSYLLEENISKYPRITIDTDTMKDLDDYTADWSIKNESHRHYLNPFSNVIFNDISQYLAPPYPTLQTVNISLIKTVKKNIKNNIRLYEFNSATYGKYWYLLDSCENLIKSTTKNI